VVRKFGEGVQLQLLQLDFLGYGLEFLGYGLEFLLGFWLFFLGALSLEKGALALKIFRGTKGCSTDLSYDLLLSSKFKVSNCFTAVL
jgi:hypothetical protein